MKFPILKWFENRELDDFSPDESNNISKKIIYNILIVLLVVLFLAASWFLYIHFFHQKKRRVIHEFGISLPVQYRFHGIDVSKHQGEILWDSVKAMHPKGIRLKFAFAKATEGASMIDKRFTENWLAMRQQKIVRGAYHFFRSSENAHKQAAIFIKTVPMQAGDLPPVLDVEVRGNVSTAKFEERVTVWLNDVENFYGVKPIVYTNKDFYNQHLAKICKNYPVWIAHYHKDDLLFSRKWLFWQHSDRGNVNGIEENVDFNVFSGDSTAFANLRYKPQPHKLNTVKLDKAKNDKKQINKLKSSKAKHDKISVKNKKH